MKFTLKKYLAPLSVLFVTVALAAVASLARPMAKSHVEGKWDLNVNTGDGGQESASMIMKVADDGAITGSVSSHYGDVEIAKGSADGDKFSIEFKLTIDNSPTDISMRGTVDGHSMKGDGTAGDGTFTYTGTRAKAQLKH